MMYKVYIYVSNFSALKWILKKAGLTILQILQKSLNKFI